MRKKYDKTKGLKALVEKKMPSVIICFADNWAEQIDNISTVAQGSRPLELTMRRRIFEARFNWEVAIGIAQSDGKQSWFDWEILKPSQSVRIGEIEDQVTDELKRLRDSRNDKYVIGYCWAAAPCGIQLTEEQLAEFFTKHGIFDQCLKSEKSAA